jgi:uncharacterized protein
VSEVAGLFYFCKTNFNIKQLNYKDLELKLPTDFSEQDLRKLISKKLRIRKFIPEIQLQSLDARQKPNVKWLVRVRVISDEIRGDAYTTDPGLFIPYKKRNQKVVVVGSGPAGFFAGFVLQKAGFSVTIIEKGPKVAPRFDDIIDFENGGAFKAGSNYCHGEGGAGTFSDGKLTSRTKGIAAEKKFVFESYVGARAPAEILYLARPHIGSDNLRTVVPNLRKQFEVLGGQMLFETEVTELDIKNGKCQAVTTGQTAIPCDMLVLAPGHSSYPTYRMLHRNGIRFRTKPFAIGVRVEHPQELINQSQWQATKLAGVKAADYKLTYTTESGLPVYSFCMCPGGRVIPSAPAHRQNIVNGVSDYARNSAFANAAVVAGTDLEKLLKKQVSFEESLSWLEEMEKRVYDLTGSYKIPGARISDFIAQKASSSIPTNSYPFEVFPFNFDELLPPAIVQSLREGLTHFSGKIRGFETGLMMGLESKTSSPVQVIRDEYRRCEGYENIFVIGEGSGYTGGITSSAVDGVKLGMSLCNL